MALVVSPTSVKVILNGVEAVHNTTTQPVDMGAMWLGSYRAWSSRNMNGLVDEVKLWNRALSMDEVRAQRLPQLDASPKPKRTPISWGISSSMRPRLSW